MAEKKNIFNAFKSASLVDWEAAAILELNGAKSIEELVHHAKDWSIQPFYDRKTSLSSTPLLTVSENDSELAWKEQRCRRKHHEYDREKFY